MAHAHILVVDDEASICEFLSRVLGDAGYVVTATTSPADALRLASKEIQPDLLLTDVKMPIMEGDVLAARVREIYPLLPILYLTGYSDQLFRDAPVLAERQAFLDKPATADAVIEAVGHLLTEQPVSRPPKPGIMSLSSLRQGLLTLNVSGRHR